MSVYEDLLNFVPWIKERSGIRIPEVANHFGWSEDQVVQYVLLASVTGPGTLPDELLDIHIDGDRINVIDTLGLDRPFRFDQIEAACILLGLEVLESQQGLDSRINSDAVTSLKEKFLSLLQSRPAVQVIPSSGTLDFQEVIQSAIDGGKKLKFQYWNESRDSNEIRVVSPVGLKFSEGLTRLNAYCHTKNGWRTFILKRIQDIEILEEAIDIPEGDFSNMAFKEVEIRLPSHLLYQLESMRVTKRSKVKENQITATIEVLEPTWLARQILSTGCQIEVLGPKKFADKVSAFIDSARAAYSD